MSTELPQTTADTWMHARFFLAVAGGEPVEEWGYQWRGLVLRHSGWMTPRTQTSWRVIHIGSGGTILGLRGNVATVMPVAGEIAMATDWTLFDMPEGWRQTDPELPAKIEAICEAHPEAWPDTGFTANVISDTDARAVVKAREESDAE